MKTRHIFLKEEVGKKERERKSPWERAVHLCCPSWSSLLLFFYLLFIIILMPLTGFGWLVSWGRRRRKNRENFSPEAWLPKTCFLCPLLVLLFNYLCCLHLLLSSLIPLSFSCLLSLYLHLRWEKYLSTLLSRLYFIRRTRPRGLRNWREFISPSLVVKWKEKSLNEVPALLLLSLTWLPNTCISEWVSECVDQENHD